jgi:hypothetical protein
VAFYVPLGPRGLIFRFGTMMIGVLGGVAYWRASRRRALAPLPMIEPIFVASEP